MIKCGWDEILLGAGKGVEVFKWWNMSVHSVAEQLIFFGYLTISETMMHKS